MDKKRKLIPHIRNHEALKTYMPPAKETIKRHTMICGKFHITSRNEHEMGTRKKYVLEVCNKCGFVFNFWVKSVSSTKSITPNESVVKHTMRF